MPRLVRATSFILVCRCYGVIDTKVQHLVQHLVSVGTFISSMRARLRVACVPFVALVKVFVFGLP